MRLFFNSNSLVLLVENETKEPSANRRLITGPPVFATIRFGFDLDLLRKHCLDHVFSLPSIQQGPGFGGWSVLSSNGSYTDGWQKGHMAYEMDSPQKTTQHLADLGLLGKRYDQPTEICFDYLAEVINVIRSSGVDPRRARIIRLSANSACLMHRDYRPDVPYFRMHVPIITNELCYYECELGISHIPADGNAHVIRVNQLHRVINESNQDRYHLVMDVTVSEDIAALLQ